MKIEFSRDYKKQYKKLPIKKQAEVKRCILMWLDNPTSPLLRQHALVGEWNGFYSISAGGDLRLVFQIVDNRTIAYFVAVGTHSQLYR